MGSNLGRSKIFISYSHEDAKDLEQIQSHLLPLARDGLIAAWDDTELAGGDDWAADIDRALAEAAVAVLLITKDFVASKFITERELPRILEAENCGELTVIPVFLRPSIVDKIDYAFGVGGTEQRVRLTKFQGFGQPDRVLMKLDKSDREEVFVELASRLLELSEGAAGPRPSAPQPDPSPASPEGRGSAAVRIGEAPLIELCFRVTEQDGRDLVTLSADGFDPASSELEIDLGETSRVSQVIAQIEGSPQKDDLMDVGIQLWEGLLSGDVERLFERVGEVVGGNKPLFHVRLEMASQRLERLPWETFYDDHLRKFLGCHPQYCVIRDSGGIPVPALGERQPGELSVLAVIPEGPGLSADREWRGLEHAVVKLGSAIRLELLEGPVTPDRLAEKLTQASWDVVHYIGFGETADDDRARILINDEDGGANWIDVETFGMFFDAAEVRLVLLSCAQGPTPSPSRSLSALGPVLLRAGVPAVVATRYELPGDVAGHFTRSFYGELVKGSEPGRVDRAMAAARRSIFLNHNATNVRGFISPVLYMVPGAHRLPALIGPEEGTVARPEAPAASTLSAASSARLATDPRLKRLLELVRKERCVPILGPGLMHADAAANGEAAPSRRELVEALARECDYPRAQELQLFEIGGDWLLDQVLQRVCQHFQHVQELYDLVEVVHRTLGRSTPPPALLQLARWPTPGIVCTTIDGLMADALERQSRQSRMVNYIDREADSDETLPLLVHLRGTLAEQESLILTEEDHDKLWQRLQQLNNQIVQLVAGFGRAILLLGVSPQDTLIRRFLHQLRPGGLSKKQGSLFFVCRDQSPVDEAYWARYETQWLSEDPAEVIAMITGLLAAEPAP